MAETDKARSDQENETPKSSTKTRWVARRIIETTARVSFHSCNMLLGDHKITREKMVGLMAGAMLGSEVAIPSTAEDRAGKTEYRQNRGGRVAAYDFNRPNKFPAEFNKGTITLVSEGKIVAGILDEIKGNDPDEPTPDDLFDIFDLSHVASLRAYTLEELEQEGLVRLTTHRQVYEEAGVFEEYAVDLGYRGRVDSPAFQITPKGNTLVELIPDRNERKAQEHVERSINWARHLGAA